MSGILELSYVITQGMMKIMLRDDLGYNVMGQIHMASPGSDKVQYVNPYTPTQIPEEVQVTICSHQVDSPLYV